MIRESDPPSVEDAHTARADMRVLPRCPRGARLGAPSASRASSVTVAAMSGSESSTSELNPCAMWLWCRSCDARYCGRARYPASSTSGRVLERQTQVDGVALALERGFRSLRARAPRVAGLGFARTALLHLYPSRASLHSKHIQHTTGTYLHNLTRGHTYTI